MLSGAIVYQLCGQFMKNSVICSDRTVLRQYSMQWTNYMESTDRMTRIIDRRDRVKYVSKKDRDLPLSYKSLTFALYGENTPEKFALNNLKRWSYYKSLNVFMKRQAYDSKLYHKLGTDLAAANFILKFNGRVKFRDFVHWTEKVDSESLPKKYDSSYVITGVDASPITMLRYEGLDNILGLVRLKWLCLSGCFMLDDWCLDRISAEYPVLEYLDISNCNMISERGLECLYKARNLKTLIVTNFHNSVALELTCALLEDCIPGLTCDIRVPTSK